MIAYVAVMDSIIRSEDPLEFEIASLETAIANDIADVAELEALLVQKRQNLHMLSVEARTLKRAAFLRPLMPAAEVPAPIPLSQPESKTGRFRNVVAQIRTSDPRLAVWPGG